MIVDSAFCDLNKMAIDIAIVILIYLFKNFLFLDRDSLTIIYYKANNLNN